MPTTYDAATLEPVTTSVARLPTPAGEDAMATVTVTADRIPWYWWLTAGLIVGYFAARVADIGRRR